jgi:hypothetical protein
VPAEVLIFELTAYEEQKQDEAHCAQFVKWSKRALRKQDGPGVRSNAAKDRRAKKDAAYDFANDSGLPEFASDPPKKKSGQQHCRHFAKAAVSYRLLNLVVNTLALGVQHQDHFCYEQNKARNEHAHADSRGPCKPEVNTPVI